MKLKLEGKLDDGAFGDVYVATDDLDRRVAVKIIKASALGVADARDHAKALARANHKNVVSVLALDTIPDPHTGEIVDCVVMELIEGETLTKRVKGEKFTIEEANKIGSSIISGIGHIHKQGMAHGDLHADNVMITGDEAKVIDILYLDSLAIMSTGSREARLKRDLLSLRLLLQQIIVHSQLDAAEATEFNNLLDSDTSISKIRDAFQEVTAASNAFDKQRLIEHSFGRIVDDGFVNSEAYASAVLDETPIQIDYDLFIKIIDEKIYDPKHSAYLRALWNRLPDGSRKKSLKYLGDQLDGQLSSKGMWWPLLRMLIPLGEEGWRGLQPIVRMRLENFITKDMLAGRKDIYQVTPISNGAVGTYARTFWPYFEKPNGVVDNILTLLRQDWYTQNYIGEYFVHMLAPLAKRTNREAEMIEALKSAYRNDARLIVNKLDRLPEAWREEIKKKDSGIPF